MINRPVIGRFLRKYRRELTLTLLFTLVPPALALIPGVGYNLSIELAQTRVIGGTGVTEGSGSRNRLFSGTLDAHFSPALYPVSYLSGSGYTFRKFQGSSEVWDHEGTQLKEAVVLGTLAVELIRNIPFFLLFGVAATLALLNLARIPPIAKPLAELQARLKSLHGDDL